MYPTATQKQILIIDRDAAAVEALRQKLAEVGFSARAITDLALAVASISEQPPHLVIVDWNVPGLAGLELIKSVRMARSPRPIRLIITSALDAERDVVAGLELGADDYIFKPYSVREVVARVSAVLRSGRHEEPHHKLIAGDLVLESSTNRVTALGKLVNLRGVEYRLLEFLMGHPGRTFNRNQLLVRIWGADSEVDERTVDVNVQRLRKILSDSGCESYLQTVRGFGYRFSVPTWPQLPAGMVEQQE